jgi:hypothetical protein
VRGVPDKAAATSAFGGSYVVECAWAMLRYNARARAAYAWLTRGGVTRKKPAIVALVRRLLVRCWAMLRDGAPWRADPAPAAP